MVSRDRKERAPKKAPTTRRALLALGVGVLAILPYLNGLRNGFTFDDVPIVARNQRIRSLSGLGRILTTDWWGGLRTQSLLYRPLAMASFSADFAASRIGEGDPPPARLPDRSARAFHVQNVLWHGAAAAALYLLVLEMFASPALALATAVLFAVHPVHTEAVDGIVGRAELMSACFAFLALLVAGRVLRDDPPGIGGAVLAGVLLFAALLSKESAIVVPVAPLLMSRTGGRGLRRVVVAFCIAVAAYLVLRAGVLGSVVGNGARAQPVNVDNPIATATGAARLLTPVRVFGHVLRLLVFPRALSADYSYAQIPVVSSPDGATLLCLAALGALVAAAVLLRRRLPAVSFGILFFFLTWALTSNFFLVIGTILGERLLFLPSAGACLAIAAGLLALGKRLGAPRVALALVAVLVLLGASRTWARNRDWKDSLTLFRSTAETSPRSCKAQQGYAAELLALGRPREAVPLAERALEIEPRYLDARQVLGKAYRLLANEEPARGSELRARARTHARALVDELPRDLDDGTARADAWNTLGAIALDDNDPAAALAAYRESLGSRSDFVPALLGLGSAEVILASVASDPRRKDELDEDAVRRFERALELDPGAVEGRQNAALALRDLASRAGDPARRTSLLARAGEHESRALAAWSAAGNLDSLANSHGVRGNQLLAEQRFPEALAEFREAVRLQPGAARGHLGVGSALTALAEQERDPERRKALVREVVGSFERALALDPRDATAHFNLGVTYLTLEHDPARVIEHFRACLALAPGSPDRPRMEQTIREMEAELARTRR